MQPQSKPESDGKSLEFLSPRLPSSVFCSSFKRMPVPVSPAEKKGIKQNHLFVPSTRLMGPQEANRTRTNEISPEIWHTGDSPPQPLLSSLERNKRLLMASPSEK